MILSINTKVNTPIGAGMVQGAFAVQSAHGENVVNGVLVRLPVNDATRPTMKQSNCLTPKAMTSGLWVFKEEEVTL